MLTTQAGEPLIKLIALAYEANKPVLLVGRHGVGKSELLAQAAERQFIGFISRDLSLMEPVDLIGIPRVNADGRTSYAPPSFLPRSGRGLIVFEELNRCPRPVQTPCLQLLTTRRLGDYALPEGWLPCAAINEGSDGYFTEPLDDALNSRFLRTRVVPDVGQWVAWARRMKVVHEKVLEFVESSPGVFEDPDANPRAWSYVSEILSAWERGERDQDLLATALAGVLGDKWALAFLRVYNGELRPLRAEEIIEAYPAHRASILILVEKGQLDAVAASVEMLKRHIQPQPVYEGVVRDREQKANVAAFFADLPPDVRREVIDWLREKDFKELLPKPGTRRVRA